MIALKEIRPDLIILIGIVQKNEINILKNCSDKEKKVQNCKLDRSAAGVNSAIRKNQVIR
jgi:hypothetical protein